MNQGRQHCIALRRFSAGHGYRLAVVGIINHFIFKEFFFKNQRSKVKAMNSSHLPTTAALLPCTVHA
jgi:hypothetical protein